MAATAVAAVALYVVIGHAAHAPIQGGSAIHGVGICLVLFTVAAILGLPSPRRMERPRRVAHVQPPALAGAALPIPDSRASPTWLGRFLN
jgi:hypothetical protein